MMEQALMDRVEELVLENKRLQTQADYWKRCHASLSGELEMEKQEKLFWINNSAKAEKDKEAMQPVVDAAKDLCSYLCSPEEETAKEIFVKMSHKIINIKNMLDECNSGYDIQKEGLANG